MLYLGVISRECNLSSCYFCPRLSHFSSPLFMNGNDLQNNNNNNNRLSNQRSSETRVGLKKHCMCMHMFQEYAAKCGHLYFIHRV